MHLILVYKSNNYSEFYRTTYTLYVVQYYIHCTVYSIIYTVRCTILYPLYGVQYYIHCTVCSTISTVRCTVLYPLNGVQYYINCTVYSTISTVQCTVLYPLYGVLHFTALAPACSVGRVGRRNSEEDSTLLRRIFSNPPVNSEPRPRTVGTESGSVGAGSQVQQTRIYAPNQTYK